MLYIKTPYHDKFILNFNFSQTFTNGIFKFQYWLSGPRKVQFNAELYVLSRTMVIYLSPY